MCDACSKAVDTSRPQSTPPSHDADRTRSQREGANAATLTAGFEVDLPTKDHGRPVRMRPSPPGHDLIRYIDGGGMGEVYVGREHFAQRIVAVKFLRPTGNPLLRDRFLREIKTLGQVEHSNVVRILSVDVERTDPYFTMEYGAGGTIADRIKAEGPYAPDKAARIGVQLASALEAVHREKIYHRDLKPSNVILTADGTPKLSDFGLAKWIEDDDELTRTTQAIGTPAFMPPEQISRKLGDYGPHTDVYGLGATLYAMLTGKAPFAGDSNEDILLKVKSDLPTRPRVLRPDLPMGLEAVVMKCLEKHPADRYATADELAKDLERCLEGKQDVRPHTWWQRVKRWVRRNRIGIGAACLALIAFGAAVAIAAHLLKPEPPVDELAEIKRKLAAGERVTLMGESGTPRWHRWKLGTATLGRSPVEGDESCYFGTGDSASLELLDDPGIERYTIIADMRYLGFGGDPSLGMVGLWFGWTEPEPAPPANIFARHYAMAFKDVKEYSQVPATEARLRVRDMQWGRRKGGLPMPHPRDFFMREQTLLKSSPGPWRRIAIRVSSNQIQFQWQSAPAAPPELISELIRKGADRFVVTTTARPGRPPDEREVPPGWSPRLPIGIWADHAAVTFKNVEIVPEP
ncbi:MAG: serine/threonine-protein kinase [Gemmataceae bacterium]